MDCLLESEREGKGDTLGFLKSLCVHFLLPRALSRWVNDPAQKRGGFEFAFLVPLSPYRMAYLQSAD